VPYQFGLPEAPGFSMTWRVALSCKRMRLSAFGVGIFRSQGSTVKWGSKGGGDGALRGKAPVEG